MRSQLCRNFITIAFIVCSIIGNAQWTQLGNVNSSSYGISLAINRGNTPYIVYSDMNNQEKATVKQYKDGTWEVVGDAGFSNNYAIDPHIAIGRDDTAYVAFSELTNGYPGKISVMKYNGTSWEYVGYRYVTPAASYFVSLTLDNNNEPYIAFEDRANSSKLSVLKYYGFAWENIGVPDFSPANATYASLAFNKSNQPYVAFRDNLQKASVMMFNGSDWIPIGVQGFSAGTVANNTSLAIDKNDTPYVAYTDMANANKATVMKFNGIDWVNAGPPGFSSTVAYDIHIAFDTAVNIPYVGYKNGSYDGRATVMRLDSGIWSVVGSEAFSPSRFVSLSLATNSYGTPYIANDSATVRVMKYLHPPYTFIGSGDWNIASNWSTNQIPPNPLPGDYSIIIDPPEGQECILNSTITLTQGSKLTVQSGKKFTVNGDIIIQ